MAEQIVIDTTVIVGNVDANDKFHHTAEALAAAIRAAQVEEVFLDCVLVETIGVLCRRSEEQKRSEGLPNLLNALHQRVALDDVTWLNHDTRRLYTSVVELVRQTGGKLNFNDALIAIFCKEYQIKTIASFDQDFDQVTWLKRIAKPEDLTPA